jgi:hypothetical protein
VCWKLARTNSARPIDATSPSEVSATRGAYVANVRWQLRWTQAACPASVETIGYIAIRVGHPSTKSRIVIPADTAIAAICIPPISAVYEQVAIVVEEVVVYIK